METKSFICINCPLGCPLTVTVENGEVKSVTGNTCKRGSYRACPYRHVYRSRFKR